MKNYILNDHGEPVIEPDLLKWAEWRANNVAAWVIAQKRFYHCGTAQLDVLVSTVFLCCDHAFSGGPPVLWETMVFGGPLNGEQDRCAGNREQAEAMHERMVARVKLSASEDTNTKPTADDVAPKDQ